ncbi:MAG: radical SAM family heme chaperone HemW [Flammeovirgaceae bacterium]|nr:radical SAM family heme chaperone HemW [Flammeovirgaceae bacterium]
MAGLYIHIPFCKQACHYCDFHFSTNLDLKTQLVKAIAAEIELQKNYLQAEQLNTIYLGGGTPSLLVEEDFDIIFSTIYKNFGVWPEAEITLEANPDDLTKEKLQMLKRAGINRLSIGIQSFHDSILTFMNRVHNAAEAGNSIANAREAGFSNISIDLIYAVPDQTDSMWLADIEQAIALAPEHISCYSLTIEEKTAFGKWKASGKLTPVDDEVAARHLITLVEKLTKAGYEHYEVSNFSKPGFHSQHNSSYWLGDMYLGVGPSAHSYNGFSRQFNLANNHLYLRSMQNHQVPCEIEHLSNANKINEYLLTRLRTKWGVDLTYLKSHLQFDLMKEHGLYVYQLEEKSLAALQANMLTLTSAGLLLADKISSDLFAAESPG